MPSEQAMPLNLQATAFAVGPVLVPCGPSLHAQRRTQAFMACPRLQWSAAAQATAFYTRIRT